MQKNHIELAGYLASSPSVRILPSGTKVANVRIAEGYRYTDRQSKSLQEHTNWHNLVLYGVLADIASTYEKGDNLYVEGSLQTRQFTPKDGSQRTVHEIVAKSCHLIEGSRTRLEPPTTNEPGAEHDASSEQQSASVPYENEWPA